jgi:hypothetical protein
MRLDGFLPVWQFNEIHTIKVNATPGRVYAAIQELTTRELSPLIFLLFDIRDLPARLTRRNTQLESFQDGPFLQQLYQGGFIPLGEDPGKEIVFGLVGQFWKLTGSEDPHIPDAQAFQAFNDPDFAKVAANLLIREKDGRVICSTETRVQLAGQPARRKFAFYWRIISMGSGIIRMLWLRAIKRKAERKVPH